MRKLVRTDALGFRRRGFALVTSLLIIAGITLFAVALFALARNELRTSSHFAQSYRARLAARAGFEDAKNLLIRHTAGDAYVISSVQVDHGEEDYYGQPYASRYAFLGLWDGAGMVQVPLFSGGIQHATGALVELEGLDPAAVAELGVLPHQPRYALNQDLDVAAGVIESLWISAPDPEHGGARAPESRPFVGYLEPAGLPDGSRFRYAYWIEDLQGYPSLDATGMWTDHHAAEGESFARDQHWFGYGPDDLRAGEPGGEEGARYELAVLQPSSTAPPRSYGYQFPRAFRGQRLTGQIAPGLSPREIHLGVWLDRGEDGVVLGDPLAYELPAGRDLLVSNFSIPMVLPEEGNRFVVGLKPYRLRPLIPFGLGYPGAGLPALNLNAAIAEEDVDGIADHIAEQLPSFDARRGGFPESYLQQLAANIIDYADENAEPTVDEDAGYRGLEAYPLVNELFVKIEYVGYLDGEENGAPEQWIVRFEATPYVELWNPTDQPVEAAEVALDFVFASPLGFEWAGEFYRLDGIANPNLIENGPAANVAVVGLEPNAYEVVGGAAEGEGGFGSIVWEIAVPKEGSEAFVVEGLVARAGEEAAPGPGEPPLPVEGPPLVRYELSVGGVVVDRSGAERAGAIVPPLSEIGPGAEDVVGDGAPPLTSGEFVIRSTNPARLHGNFGGGPSGGEITTHYGDTLMAYHSGAAQLPVPYARDATPGGRNASSELGEDAPVVGEVRHRDWPDRGYDAPLGGRPGAPEISPDEVAPAPEEPLLAPWRLSNLGRLYSLSELGHIHDPVMWRVADGATAAWAEREASVWDLPPNASGFTADAGSGGGNSLRIGRREHPLFSGLGLRASQLLDIFHVGTTGTNLEFGTGEGEDFVADTSADAYRGYDPADHQPPPTAPDAEAAATRPFRDVYPEDIHAQGDFRWIYGHLNPNTLPEPRDFRYLLEGLFTSDNIAFQEAPVEPAEPGFRQAEEPEETLSRQLENTEEIIAALRAVRPFYAPSQVADAVAWAVDGLEGLPDYYADDVAEEAFARLHNTSTLGSRHFRIYARGEYLSPTGRPLASVTRVYEVFLRPVRDLDDDPDVDAVRCEILSERDR